MLVVRKHCLKLARPHLLALFVCTSLCFLGEKDGRRCSPWWTEKVPCLLRLDMCSPIGEIEVWHIGVVMFWEISIFIVAVIISTKKLHSSRFPRLKTPCLRLCTGRMGRSYSGKGKVLGSNSDLKSGKKGIWTCLQVLSQITSCWMSCGWVHVWS